MMPRNQGEMYRPPRERNGRETAVGIVAESARAIAAMIDQVNAGEIVAMNVRATDGTIGHGGTERIRVAVGRHIGSNVNQKKLKKFQRRPARNRWKPKRRAQKCHPPRPEQRFVTTALVAAPR
jgi:hypothetical protein